MSAGLIRPDGADTPPFGSRLAAAVADRGPLCVGIDPHQSLLVDWGVGDDLDGLRRFTDAVVEALAGSVAVLKPQMAFYERFGARGVAVLEDAVAAIREAGALVLLDAKRGDIGSTMEAYATYLRSDHPMQVDAITVSPYLGPESLEPARSTAAALRRRPVRARAHVQPRRRDLPARRRERADPGADHRRPTRRRHRPRLEHPRLGGR